MGRATVERFIEEGVAVVIADVDGARGEALAQQLGTAVAFKRTDVANADHVQDLIDFAVARFGGLHVLFNNAGIAEAPGEHPRRPARPPWLHSVPSGAGAAHSMCWVPLAPMVARIGKFQAALEVDRDATGRRRPRLVTRLITSALLLA